MKRWFRTEQPPDTRPLVSVVEAPNNTTHEYRIARELGVITTTPHEEFFGKDMGRIYKYPLMDEATQLLYDNIRTLDERIVSVSIHPFHIKIQNEWQEGRFNRVKAEWLPGFDAAVVDCLAKHMGWPDGAQMSVRRQTEEELWRGMDALIAQAVSQGVKPPSGWPYRR